MRMPPKKILDCARRLLDDEIIVDLFAGGGGASLGIELALGRSPTIAVNHDKIAVAMHKVNHPDTEHWIEDVREADPRILCAGRKVGLLWASPDCKMHSRARNGMIQRDKEIRCLADVIITWARAVCPRVIFAECVEELQKWGPLDENGLPDKSREGEDYQRWWASLERLGYVVESRVLSAADFGAPTSRKRLFVQARCDGLPIVWPEPTHGPGREIPWLTAASCIDYSIPCPSIFLTKKEAKQLERETGIRCKRPLVHNTKRRIGRGIYKHVIDHGNPFIIPVTHPGDQRVHDINEPVRTITGANRGELALVTPVLTSYYGGAAEGRGGSVGVGVPMPTSTTKDRFGLIVPTLVQTGYGERPGQAPRCLDLHTPLGTIMSGGDGGVGKHALVAALLTRNFSETKGGWNGSAGLDKPMPTVTCTDHNSLTTSTLVKLRGTSDAHLNATADIREPMDTISANGYHFAEVRTFLRKFHDGKPIRGKYVKVKINGVTYVMADIGFRMLVARELYRAQGFPDSYTIDPYFDYEYVSSKGKVRVVRKRLTGKDQIKKCGNSVSPPIAAALVKAAFPETVVQTHRWAA